MIVVGTRLGPSDWLTVEQPRIDAFATAVDDLASIHVTPALAAAGPYGVPVAHGFLTLALAVRFWDELTRDRGWGTPINYGVERVRFPAAVPVGARLRGRFVVATAEPAGTGTQTAVDATLELEGSARPACVARLLFRLLP
ncbi:MaoC family dehydratase [Patulibacter sp. S7RM1-6]